MYQYLRFIDTTLVLTDTLGFTFGQFRISMMKYEMGENTEVKFSTNFSSMKM